jgi:hypothetical protein
MPVSGVVGPRIAGYSGEKRCLRQIKPVSVRWVTYRNKQAPGVSCTLRARLWKRESELDYEENGVEHNRGRIGGGRLRRRVVFNDLVHHQGCVDTGDYQRDDVSDDDDRSGHEAQEAEGAPQAQARDDDCGHHDAGAPGHDAFLASARHHDERSGPGGRGSEPEWREQQRWRRDDEHEQPGLRPGSAGLLTAEPPRAAGRGKKLRLFRSFFPSASREPGGRVAGDAVPLG